MNSAPKLDQADKQGVRELASLPGMETVSEQLAGRIAVLQAEQGRRQAGTVISRPAWKNLVFTGGPGSGKSRAAKAVARIYHDLGLLAYGHVHEVAAADLAGATPQETSILIAEAVKRSSGDILMITDAHAWHGLPDRGQQPLRFLYKELTESRDERRDELAVILAGHTDPLHDLLRASPALAARFPAVIGFPGYTTAQLTAIFTALAGEAGFTLTPAARRKAATVLAQAETSHGTGNARLAVQLLDHVTASQSRRVTAALEPQDPAGLSMIRVADIPGHLHPHDPPAGEWPGQYL